MGPPSLGDAASSLLLLLQLTRQEAQRKFFGLVAAFTREGNPKHRGDALFAFGAAERQAGGARKEGRGAQTASIPRALLARLRTRGWWRGVRGERGDGLDLDAALGDGCGGRAASARRKKREKKVKQ